MRPEPPQPDLEIDDSGEPPPRRRHPRFTDPDLAGHLPLRARARVIDLSLDGIGLESVVPLPHDRPCEIRLDDERESLALSGRSRWQHVARLAHSEIGEAHVVYRCGLQFETTARGVQGFLARHAETPITPRRPPRFRLRTPRPATVEARYPFRVRSISRTGMLIEVDRFETPDSFVEPVLELPDGALALRTRIVNRQSVAAVRPRQRVGLEFEPLDRAREARLLRFLENAAQKSASPEGRGPAAAG